MTPSPTVAEIATVEPTAVVRDLRTTEADVMATRYGESYNGLPLGCGASPATYLGSTDPRHYFDGKYHSDDALILAAPPARYDEWPCGTVLRLTAPSGAFLDVVRVDSCPGCGANHVDLSERGIAILCGYRCDYLGGLRIEVLR